ncbi:hypothetical protein D5H75_10800 [Bailinhaonella thermotolerans]|uniref:GH26 domain-containing protein n=1 Tax=Bailinhaonella thermotolerans TaxID=1070861 RepID=A0A3A4BFN1_9ACTN|nr:hypothetical protein D5H75_10800 [Bailinhaonella thermotolerans]
MRGGGNGADDYRRMFRHVVTRLRGHGVTNAVTVMTYMGAVNWGAKPWFGRLYPGDDVVDWIALDPYADGRVDDFAALVNRRRREFPGWPGFYRWAARHHPGKPLMVGEWGVFERPRDPGFKRRFYASVRRQAPAFSRIKALVYFESPRAPRGDTRFDTTPGGLAEFRRLAASPHFTAPKLP